TPDGRPYFVMEYIRGESITAYCAKHKLSIRERLDLFLQACDGVQHAHQKGIIHRDLKPSNVLVAIQGDRPVPKIIDFGVAKATTQSLTDRTLYTELGQFVGTPEYMSPEQAEMSGLDIDTRTDVYSLGAILYELLTGVLPFDSKVLRAQMLDEIRRTIREVDPPRPSTRVTTAAAGGDAASRPPRVEPAKLAAELRGDLDWITMKALEKDRTRRYGSASDLAADVHRHLDHQPVLAGPPTATYRVGKFVRRHRGGVATTAAAAVLLIGFGVTMAVQARRLAQERDRAARGEATATAVKDFLEQDVLGQATTAGQIKAGAAQGDPNLTVRAALDRAAANVGSRFDQQPLVKASLEHTIGKAYASIALYRQAREHEQRALDLRARLLGPDDPDTLVVASSLAGLDISEDHMPAAEQAYRHVYELAQRRFGPRDRITLTALLQLAIIDTTQGRYASAEARYAEMLPIATAALGAEDLLVARMKSRAGYVYMAGGKPALAEPLLTEALAIDRRVLGSDHPQTLDPLTSLAQIYGGRGEVKQAEALRRDILRIRMRSYGADHPGTLLAMNNLAVNLENQEGREAEAASLLEQVVEGRTRVLGPRHSDTLMAMGNLGDLYRALHRTKEAEVLLRQAVEGLRSVGGPARPATLAATIQLVQALLDQKQYAEAETYARALVDGEKTNHADHWERYWAEGFVGQALLGQQRYADAEAALRAAYDGLVQRKKTIPAFRMQALDDTRDALGALYTAMRKPAQAAQYKQD
ncbi:MAG TPA: serine/threonine-protein kinase, partial [Vicinamibacterales bacterium]|nr:serine/threonine-protein kinase [Vicinamibacterales bacterium]